MNEQEFSDLRDEIALARRMGAVERDVAVLKTEMETVRESLRTIRELPMEVAKIAGALEGCARDTAYLRSRIDLREEERKEEKEQAIIDKRSDRRWFVGTSLTTGGLLIASAAFFIDKIP